MPNQQYVIKCIFYDTLWLTNIIWIIFKINFLLSERHINDKGSSISLRCGPKSCRSFQWVSGVARALQKSLVGDTCKSVIRFKYVLLVIRCFCELNQKKRKKKFWNPNILQNKFYLTYLVLWKIFIFIIYISRFTVCVSI